MKIATAAGISVGLLVALLVLFCVTALTVIAVLRKLGKEDQIPEAIRATSAYVELGLLLLLLLILLRILIILLIILLRMILILL